MNSELPAAVLWDMDGTIIDSEEYWIIAEEELVHLFGGTWSHQDGLELVGNGLPETAKKLQSRGVNLSIDEIIQSLTTRVLEQLEGAVTWRPGAVEVMKEFHALGVPQMMVTMSIERMARAVSQLIPGSPLQDVVAGDNVIQSKPDPEAYLLAAERLGVNVTDCVAFEDSPSGVASASRADAFTVGVTNLIDLSSSPAHHVLHTLAGVSATNIVELFAQRNEPQHG